jgi:hypothetical protein
MPDTKADKPAKPRYERPIVIDLSAVPTGQGTGACFSGSSAIGDCVTGTAASASCNSGVGAA